MESLDSAIAVQNLRDPAENTQNTTKNLKSPTRVPQDAQ